MMSRKMWVVLRFSNSYNQSGGYFSGVFDCENDCSSPTGHFGRREQESTWYLKRPVDVGITYKEPEVDDEQDTSRVAT